MTSVVAYTQLTLMCITKTDFKWIFGINSSEMEMTNNINPDSYALYSKMKNLTMSRKNKICEFVNKNSSFSKLTESQKVQMNLFLRLVKVKEGAVLWSYKSKEPPTYSVFLFQEDCISFKTPDSYKWPVKRLKEGHFLGDFPSIVAGQQPLTEAVCIRDCEVIEVRSADLLEFLRKNPGMKLIMREEYIIY